MHLYIQMRKTIHSAFTERMVFLLVEALPQAPVNAVFQTAAARFFESLMEKYRVGKPVQHLKKSVAFLIVMLI